MSTFIRIERPGYTPRLIRIKEEEAVFGEDAAGILTVRGVTNPLFFLKFGQITAHSHLLKEAQQVKETSRTIRFFSYLDLRFTVLTCSTISAFYANILDLTLSELTQLIQRSPPVLSVRYAGFQHRFPLIDVRKILVGSDPRCHITIGLSGIRPFHCTLQYHSGVLNVTPLQGLVGANNDTISHIQQFMELPLTLLLKPLDLPLAISQPA